MEPPSVLGRGIFRTGPRKVLKAAGKRSEAF